MLTLEEFFSSPRIMQLLTERSSPQYPNPTPSTIIPPINKPQLIYVTQFPVLFMWFLQASCGLRLTNLNHNRNRYFFYRNPFDDQCFMRTLLSWNHVDRYLQNPTGCMLLTIPYPMNLIKGHHHRTGTIVTKLGA